MGLLDFLNPSDPDQQQLQLAIGLGLLSGGMPGGARAMQEQQRYSQASKRQGLLDNAQLENYKAQADERRARAQREQAEMVQAERIRAGLPGLFRQGGMSGGQAVPQEVGGVPMFGKPMGVTPMRQEPGGFDLQGAMALGITDPDRLTKLAGLANINRPRATRQMEVDDGRGGKRIALVDDYGQEVAGFAGYTAPVQVNRGGSIDFVKPAPGMSLSVGMSPSERDASARGWAGVNQGAQRLALDAANGQAGKAPAGYRFRADGQGLEYIPGGPADPNAAKKAAPTEFQGKSATYGSRAQAADQIINDLEGKYSPMAVNSKLAVGNTPLIGGALEAVANAALSSSGQKAEQAQRDFVNAVLRQESGAAISAGEFENARKQYFPQPFDSPAVKQQKAQNRALAIKGFMNNARTTAQPVPAGGATGSFDEENDPLGLRK